MARIRITPSKQDRRNVRLVDDLSNELRLNREFGQPFIREEELPRTGAMRVTVIWDMWEPVPFDERAEVIVQAYQRAESDQVVQQLTLAIGLTVPEASDQGMLPYQIATLLRKTDSVNFEQCRQAMLEQGGSTLRNSKLVELRFATVEEAEACLARLKQRLPGSDDVWGITAAAGSLESLDIS